MRLESAQRPPGQPDARSEILVVGVVDRVGRTTTGEDRIVHLIDEVLVRDREPGRPDSCNRTSFRRRSAQYQGPRYSQRRPTFTVNCGREVDIVLYKQIDVFVPEPAGAGIKRSARRQARVAQQEVRKSVTGVRPSGNLGESGIPGRIFAVESDDAVALKARRYRCCARAGNRRPSSHCACRR